MTKVFISSTAVDLVAHRSVADDTILRLSYESWGMERFGPLARRAVTSALEVRRRIERPGIPETERWLARVV